MGLVKKSITVTDHQEKWIKAQVESGQYGKPAFRLLPIHPWLAGVPLLSRRRYEIQSHVVFYRPEDPGAFIVRVLHESRDYPRHL